MDEEININAQKYTCCPIKNNHPVLEEEKLKYKVTWFYS